MKETFVAETLIRRNIDRNKEQIRYLERKIEATNVLHSCLRVLRQTVSWEG